MAAGPVVPLDDSSIYASGLYVLISDRWFSAEQGGRWPRDVVAGVRAGEVVPDGFVKAQDRRKYVATKSFTTADLAALCWVEARCTWKNRAWSITKIDDTTRLVTLQIATTVRGYPQHDQRPEPADFWSWPGVEYRDRDQITVTVRPDEMANVMLLVTPFEVPLPVAPLLDDDIQVWPRSAPASPWLPRTEALRLVRESLVGQETGSYPVESIRANRLRDGWRVWAPPPPPADPLDMRVGWAVWYVADDGVMWRSSTSTEFDAASIRMTRELSERLQLVLR
ncbi:hypothetical protein AAFP35_17490 [Gordonia sp. CPCC 206044]|uniref:hypothetical protein n=1 Tax=Gordonia sp. CPCC 206044 TaxID=3140793 RepID=UPI003AF3D8B2